MMNNTLNFKPPFDMDINVNIKVVNSKGKITNEINKHNKATFNMISGIVKFLRGEFNETLINVNSIGYDGPNAKYYIPSFIGFGNGGTGIGSDNLGTLLPSDKDSGFKYLDNNTLYSSTALSSEIFKKFDDGNGQENHRIPIQRSTFNETSRNGMEVLTISSTIKFSNIKDYRTESNFYYTGKDGDENYIPVKWLNYNSLFDGDGNPLPDAEFKIVITELGLFSGDITDAKSKLLARLILNSDTPLIVDSSSTVIVNWMLGVYSINDMLYREDKEGMDEELDYYDYKYVETPTVFTSAVWQDGDEEAPINSLVLNPDGTYTATDTEGNTHTIIVTYDSEHKISSISYDGDPVEVIYDSSGNLIRIGDSTIDVSLYS